MSYPGGHPHTCSGLWLGRGGDETTVELAWLAVNKQTMCVSVVDDDYITARTTNKFD